MAVFIPEDKISEIKNAADIVDIVSEAVLLKKAGKNHIGLCPFHSEKTPSFTVSPDKQIFYCFGCGTGGNVFSFLMKQEGLSFPEAVRVLGKRYGIDIPERPLSPEQKRKISERESLFDINRRAMEFYHQALKDSGTGQAARSYLKKRGISQKTIDDFKIGYAREGWDYLLNFFLKKRISPALLEKSGLVLPKKDKSGYYDRFRNRILFPIFDASMQVVGFGGRVLDDSLPKYLNSPETLIYNKRRSLYGIQRAKEKCRSAGSVFIVEGYLDVIALHQHGIENSVATLGTALTPDHVRFLTRFASNMVLVYDSDDAGIRSAKRCIDTFWKEHVDFRRQDVYREESADTHILVLPAGHDPDSYIFEKGPESFLEAAASAPGIITFLMNCAIDKHGLSTEGKVKVIKEMQGPLAAINDRVAQGLYIQKLAERLGIAENAILERISQVSARITERGFANDEPPASADPASRPGVIRSAPEGQRSQMVDIGSRFERQIIAMMLQFPDSLPEVGKLNALSYFENMTLKNIGEVILSSNLTSANRISELMSRVDSEQKQALIASLAMGDESWNFKGCLQLLDKFVENGQKLRDSGALEEQIKVAEKSNDHDLLITLLNQKQKMAERSEKQKMAILSEK
ncbi:MAG: DNA primase [Desulfobacteraceae bacterium]|nr:DNA primase [Desulfobacteraceae bacterium]